jgi:hypothetical protein
VLRVAPPVVRSFEAGPEGLDVICIGGRKPKGGDTERFETSGTDRLDILPTCVAKSGESVRSTSRLLA